MKKKKSMCLLIAWILGAVYVLYLFSYFAGANANTADAAEAIGAGIATALVMPHMIVTLLAVIFNILGWAMNKRGFALTGGILYAVAMVLFPLYFFFVIVQMILSFVGFARLKKLNSAPVLAAPQASSVTRVSRNPRPVQTTNDVQQDDVGEIQFDYKK